MRARTRRAALTGLAVVVAVPPSLFGLNLVSYSVGSPDSPRFYVGLIAVAALVVGAVPLHAAGRLLCQGGWRPPLVVPVLGAAGVLALVVLSVPLQYDQEPPVTALMLATAGVVAGGAALSARAPRLAIALGLVLLAVFYAVCLLLDAASFAG